MRTDDLAHLVLPDAVGMLRRDEHRRRPHRLAADILQRDLALGVRPEQRGRSRVPRLGQRAQDGVRIKDRRRHQFGGLGAGIAEHHALVAGALVLVAGGVDALGDIGRLVVDQAIDRRALPMKIVLLVADLADRLARHVDQQLRGDRGRAAGFAGEDDAVGRGQRFDAAARLRLGGEEGVDDRVGDAVANLVGVPFRHRLAGKNKIVLGQETISPQSANLPEPNAGRRRADG